MNTHFPFLLAAMRPEGLLVLRIIGIVGVIAIIPLGVYLYRNQDRWFGRCSETPSETSGSLGYGRMQAWLVYLGALHIALYLALGF